MGNYKFSCRCSSCKFNAKNFNLHCAYPAYASLIQLFRNLRRECRINVHAYCGLGRRHEL